MSGITIDDSSESERGQEPSEDCISSYFKKFGKEIRGCLVPFAAEVFFLVKVGGVRRCAEHFSDILKRPVSTKPVMTIMEKIKRGELIITQEAVIEAVLKAKNPDKKPDPAAKAFATTMPWLTDPKVIKSIEEEPLLSARKRGRPRKKRNESGAESGEKPANSGAVLVTKPAQTEQDSEQQPDQNRSGSEGIGAEKPAGSVTNPEKNPAISDQIGDQNDDNPPPGRGLTPAQVRELRLSKSGTTGAPTGGIDEEQRQKQVAIAARLKASREARRNKPTSAD